MKCPKCYGRKVCKTIKVSYEYKYVAMSERYNIEKYMEQCAARKSVRHSSWFTTSLFWKECYKH
jgi:DNA polymerase II large subunit